MTAVYLIMYAHTLLYASAWMKRAPAVPRGRGGVRSGLPFTTPRVVWRDLKVDLDRLAVYGADSRITTKNSKKTEQVIMPEKKENESYKMLS